MKKDFEPLKCANTKCRMELLKLRSVDMLQTPPKIGDIVMCGNCGCPNEVTLTGMKLISKEDFKNLKVEEKADLTFAARAITRNLKNN